MKIDLFIHVNTLETHIDSIKWTKISTRLTQFLKDKGLTNTSRKTIEVNFQDDETIREINKLLRNQDKTTDVLSWNMTENEDNESALLGEIHISDNYVIQKSKEKNLDLKDEIIFLVIHGFLHIMGYDHNSDEEEEEMNKETLLILNDLGIDYSDKLG